jgi:hypothetical protein
MNRMLGAILAITLLELPLWAHHSFAMFEMDKDVSYTGVITEVKWQNPHIHFVLRIDPGPGVEKEQVGTWEVEAAAIAIMSRQGWNKNTLKVGDKVTLVGHPLRSGEKGLSLFYLVRPDGSHLYTDIARPKKSGAQ